MSCACFLLLCVFLFLCFFASLFVFVFEIEFSRGFLLHCVLSGWLAVVVGGADELLEARVDDLVGLHGGDEDVGDPEEDEYARCDDLDAPGASELAVAEFAPSQEDHDGAHRKTAKQRHGEAQAGNQSRNSL